MGGFYGCGCKEVYRYSYYLSLLLLYLLFFAVSLLFVHFLKCFLFLLTLSWAGVIIVRKSPRHAFLASFNRNTARKRYP